VHVGAKHSGNETAARRRPFVSRMRRDQ
jgi:hypothetical protein